MSDWKNDRAEQAMREADKEMMKKAAEASKKIEDEKWDKIKEFLYASSKAQESDIEWTKIDEYTISWIVDELRKKYELPKSL